MSNTRHMTHRLRRVLTFTAAAAAIMAGGAGAASADPLCVKVTYSVLGNGSTVGPCVNTPFPAISTGGGVGNPSMVYVGVDFTIPLP